MNNVEISGISKSYDNFQLKNVCFNIPAGAIVGLIGENGAGKSTIIRSILNIINLDGGNIKIFGEDSTSLPSSMKEDIGVVLDANVLYPTLTVKNVEKIMSNIYANWDSECFENYMKKLNVPTNKRIKVLSKGMQMKLLLAIALSHNAKLLILDEATVGLDPIVRTEVLNILLEFIQNEQNSVLLSSHITSDLEKIADYIVFIHDGEVLMDDVKDDLIYSHGIIRCTSEIFNNIDPKDIIKYNRKDMGYDVLVKDKSAMQLKYPRCVIDNPNLEDLMFMHVKGETK